MNKNATSAVLDGLATLIYWAVIGIALFVYMLLALIGGLQQTVEDIL